MLSRVVLAVGVGQVVGSTLKRLAERGFVHGQLDPRRNIVVSPANEAYVLEAGYSLLFGEDRAAMLADPMYRAPEQLHGAAADHRSDIYALGLSLHAYIAGEPPFHADDPAALLARCREGSPRPLAEVVDSHRVKRLSALLARATAADPAARLQSWSDLLDPLSEMIATMLRVGERKGLLPDQGEASPRRRSLGVGAPRAAFRDPSPERLGRDAKRGAHRARLRAEAAKLKKAGEGGATPSSSEGGGDARGSDKEPSSGEDPPASDPLKPPRRPE
jgi:serine/threonine-protein kinase